MVGKMTNQGLYTNQLISLQQAGKIYSHTSALKNVDLNVYKGEFLTIFGPNGAGKSTLLKVISMQSRLSYGTLLYNGVPSQKIKDEFRSNFGIISHQSFVYDGLSVMENLKFYGELYNVKNVEQKALELVKQLDLYKRKDDAVNTFSRGMLQRVSIARALIHSPEIIFLDEPYTGLDSAAANKLSLLLKEQLQNRKTIIMVTHDIKTGLDLARRVIIMRKGQIVYNMEKENINIEQFEHEYINIVNSKESTR